MTVRIAHHGSDRNLSIFHAGIVKIFTQQWYTANEMVSFFKDTKMQKTLLLTLTTLGLSLYHFSLSAQTITQRIAGNPINRRDDYTINSNTTKQVTIQCSFTNNGTKKAALNIWTSPTQTKPKFTIHLKSASGNKPSILKKTIRNRATNRYRCNLFNLNQESVSSLAVAQHELQPG